MSAPAIGSILLGSDDPESLKRWYQRAFDAEEEGGALVFGPVSLFIEAHSEVKGRAVDAARYILNLNVADCRGLEEHLKDVGVQWLRPVEDMPFGTIGTVVDPDGNYVQIIQWGSQPESHS